MLIYHPKGEGEMGLKLVSGQATVTSGSISYPPGVLRSQKGRKTIHKGSLIETINNYHLYAPRLLCTEKNILETGSEIKIRGVNLKLEIIRVTFFSFCI